jgi:hypothetical protein
VSAFEFRISHRIAFFFHDLTDAATFVAHLRDAAWAATVLEQANL